MIGNLVIWIISVIDDLFFWIVPSVADFQGLLTGTTQASVLLLGYVRPLTCFIDVTALKVALGFGILLGGLRLIMALVHLLKP